VGGDVAKDEATDGRKLHCKAPGGVDVPPGIEPRVPIQIQPVNELLLSVKRKCDLLSYAKSSPDVKRYEARGMRVAGSESP